MGDKGCSRRQALEIKMGKIEKISDGNQVLAFVVRDDFVPEKEVEFIEPNDVIQLGFHNRKKGVVCKAHEHPIYEKLENIKPAEIFYVKEGKIQVDLYNEDVKKKEVILNKGDLIYIYSGHGLKFLEDSKLFEIKQGPYRELNDKRFLE